MGTMQFWSMLRVRMCVCDPNTQRQAGWWGRGQFECASARLHSDKPNHLAANFASRSMSKCVPELCKCAKCSAAGHRCPSSSYLLLLLLLLLQLAAAIVCCCCCLSVASARAATTTMQHTVCSVSVWGEVGRLPLNQQPATGRKSFRTDSTLSWRSESFSLLRAIWFFMLLLDVKSEKLRIPLRRPGQAKQQQQ